MKGKLKKFWKRLCQAGAVCVLLLAGFWIGLRFVPLPAGLFSAPLPELEFMDRHGRPLRAVGNEQAQYVKRLAYAEIAPALVQATVAAEDKRFWTHQGVDWRATLRASLSLVRHRHVFSGASTITQQLIKRAEPRPRTFSTKLKEAAQALRLEQVWDKQRIITEYLNRVEYGNRCIGCAEAAAFYFGKPARELSIAEAAFLAGLPRAPGRLNPHQHFQAARERQLWILQRLRINGVLTRQEYQRALDEPLRLRPPGRTFEAPHFVDLVLAQIGNGSEKHEDGKDQWESIRTNISGRSLRTTLDLELNQVVEASLRRRLVRLAAQRARNGAAVVLQNASGNVLALVGSENYFAPGAGQVNGAWTPRSAGSTFKPFTYLLALERGATPATVVADVPTEFPTTTGVFAPVNYDRRCYGPMRYRLALANSLNISAVKVLDHIGGPDLLQKRLQAWGLTTLTRPPDFYGLGLTIGNAEARLLELANAYACLARLGTFLPFRLTLSATPNPNLNLNPNPKSSRLFTSDACYLVADILSDNQARTLAFGTDSPLRFDFPVACKTGTSSDFRDNWAFGYTPEFTVGVWVGNFDGTPMDEVSGVTGAAPILHDIFEHLHERYGATWYAPRSNIVERWIHPLTGKLLAVQPTSGNPDFHSAPKRVQPPSVQGVLEKFIARSLPPEEQREDYDQQARVRLPAEYRDWIESGDNWLAGRVIASARSELRLVCPLPGSTFYLDPDLPPSSQRLRLKADGPAGLVWESDTLKLVSGPEGTDAILTAGRHRLIVCDPVKSMRLETWIVVKEL